MSDNPSGWGRRFVGFLVGMLVAVACYGLHEHAAWRVHAQDSGLAPGFSTGERWSPPVWNNALISGQAEIVYENSEGKVVLTIYSDGTVAYGAGFKADTAAKEFWGYLAKEGIAGQCLPMAKVTDQSATVTANPTPAQRRRSAMQAQVHAQDASAVTFSAGTPLGTFTVSEPPFDVPPKQDLETTGYENCKPGESRDIIVCDDKKAPGAPYCEDKSRFLLMSQDGKWHCLRLVPPNGAQR